jgi:hypothetical protein
LIRTGIGASSTSSRVWARTFWKFRTKLSFVVYSCVRIHQYWRVIMLRLAVELDRGKIRCRRSSLFTKKNKRLKRKDNVSYYIIGTELEHPINHWQRSSIERAKTHGKFQHILALTKEEMPYGHRVTTSQFLSSTIIL